jgi:polysaccharide biosynthesis transport protein
MMSLSQAPARTAGRTNKPVSASWEAPVPAGEQADHRPKLIGGALTLTGVAAFLRRNGKKIGLLALILFTAGIATLSIVPVRYAATALVFVDPRELHVTADPDVLPGIGQDSAALQSLIEIAKSDGFLKPLIEKLKIADDEDVSGGETNASKLLEKFRARLDISRRGLTYIIAMTFTHRTPQQAAYYSNAIAEAFVANQTQARTATIEGAASFLNSRLKTLNDQVRAADDAVAAFKAEHKIINAGKESTTRQLRVTELNQQVSAARLLGEEAKNRYEQAQRNLKANVEGPTGSRPDLLSTLRAQRAQLNDQIAQKRAVFGDRHPELVISYNQLGELDRHIETERKRNVESAKSDYETARNQQKSLEQQLASLEGEMLTDVQASVKLQELQRNADASHNIYEQFLSRYKTTNEQSMLQTSQARIVSLATVPTRPTRPTLPVILVALALGALISSAMIVIVLDAAKRSDEAPEAEVSTAAPAKADAPLNLPVWGRIPDLSVSLADRLGWRRPAARSAAVDLRSHLQPLLARIADTPGQRGKVILVTSGEAGVGKSAVARSLNAAAIERGMLSVLIQIAAEGTTAQQRQLPHEDNASNRGRALITTAASLTQLLRDDRDLLTPATAGDVRSEFDLIVIDAPALQPQADVAAIAARADFAVIVVAEAESNAGLLRSASAALSKSGPRLGIVINKVNALPASPANPINSGREPARSSGLA